MMKNGGVPRNGTQFMKGIPLREISGGSILHAGIPYEGGGIALLYYILRGFTIIFSIFETFFQKYIDKFTCVC